MQPLARQVPKPDCPCGQLIGWCRQRIATCRSGIAAAMTSAAGDDARLTRAAPGLPCRTADCEVRAADCHVRPRQCHVLASDSRCAGSKLASAVVPVAGAEDRMAAAGRREAARRSDVTCDGLNVGAAVPMSPAEAPKTRPEFRWHVGQSMARRGVVDAGRQQ